MGNRIRAPRGSARTEGSARARPSSLLGVAAAVFAGSALAAVEIAPPAAQPAPVVFSESLGFDAGAALRAAMQAAASGDRSLAEERLLAVAAQAPVVADYADLERMRLRVAAGAYAEAIALGQNWAHPESPLVADREEILGAAYEGLGQAEEAAAAWQRAAKASDDLDRQAALLRAIAENRREADAADATEAAYLALWTAHPLTPEGEQAEQALARIAAAKGRDPRTAVHFRRRGDALFRKRHNESALAAYERALAFEDQTASERDRARRQRARTLFRLRRYDAAAEAFGQLPPRPEHRIARARAFARGGDVLRGIRELLQVAAEQRGPTAARARYLAALLLEGEGDDARARELYEEVSRSSDGTPYAFAALWRFGWSEFRSGNFDAAARYFDRLVRGDGAPLSLLRARYWRARARQRLGDPSAASDFAALAAEFPFSYYGWRARLRLEAGPPAPPPAAVDLGLVELGPEALARPRILLAAGMEREARIELDRLYGSADGLADRLALASLYGSVGDFHHAQRVVVEAYNETLARGPRPGQVDLWWHAWPAPFEDDVRRATADGDLIEPGLVYALMREESGYRPAVVSTVGARGLLQIMPETGERLARDVALTPYSSEDLFRPEVNIRLGSYYLSRLLAQFGGRKSAAIASYNAGPSAVSGWIDPKVEDDEWVEAIPYDQTRSYVKRVLRSLYVYRVLY